MSLILSFNVGIFMCLTLLVGTVIATDIIYVDAQVRIPHSTIGNLPVINQEVSEQQGNNEKISFRIKGIDYSMKIAQIIVTMDGKTFAKNFDPISLLDPHDDGNGVIQFEMLVPKNAMKPGSTFTSCIKVLEDTDNYGNELACQTGSVDEISSLSGENKQVYLKL